MPDTPFKAMGRERKVWFGDTIEPDWYRRHAQSSTCEKCGGNVYEGDWPFCKGDPADHRRD